MRMALTQMMPQQQHQTFYLEKQRMGGVKLTGTMTNRGTVTKTLSAGGSYTIPSGYHSGSGKVTASSLSSQTSATASASDIKSGKTAYVNGSKITGTFTTPFNACEASSVSISGYSTKYTGMAGRIYSLATHFGDYCMVGLGECSNSSGTTNYYSDLTAFNSSLVSSGTISVTTNKEAYDTSSNYVSKASIGSSYLLICSRYSSIVNVWNSSLVKQTNLTGGYYKGTNLSDNRCAFTDSSGVVIFNSSLTTTTVSTGLSTMPTKGITHVGTYVITGGEVYNSGYKNESEAVAISSSGVVSTLSSPDANIYYSYDNTVSLGDTYGILPGGYNAYGNSFTSTCTVYNTSLTKVTHSLYGYVDTSTLNTTIVSSDKAFAYVISRNYASYAAMVRIWLSSLVEGTLSSSISDLYYGCVGSWTGNYMLIGTGKYYPNTSYSTYETSKVLKSIYFF